MKKVSTQECPCGSSMPFSDCCGPLLEGNAIAPTAEALMRSRYTAYTLSDHDYLKKTWDSKTCPASFGFDPLQKWIGLKIVRTEAGREEDDTGIVEFVARYKIGGRAFRLQETSRFRKLDGLWVYVDGADPDNS